MTPARITLVLIPLAAIGILLPACGRKTQVTTDTTTKGQELQDLDDARSKGIITENEYQRQRKRILKGD